MGVCVCLCLLAGPPSVSWDGFENFFNVLAGENVSVDDWRTADCIFVLGDAPANPGPTALRAAVRDGATLCIATESLSARNLLARFGFSLGRDVFVTPNVLACFNWQPDCPLVTEFLTRSALFDDVVAIAVNRAREVRGAGTPLAIFTTTGSARPAFIRELREGRGRVIAIGDQSLFINLMLPERDNERFLRNMLARRRTAAVYVHGQPCTTASDAAPPLEIPEGRLPIPDLAPSIADFNRLLADAQAAAPIDSINRSAFPILCFATGVLIVWVLLRCILSVWLPPHRPFGTATPAVPPSAAFLARRLAAAAPSAERPRLLRRAAACGRPRVFARFVKEFFSLEERSPHEHTR